MKQILENQIKRLARIYISKPVTADNIEWHRRVTALQVAAIMVKKSLPAVLKVRVKDSTNNWVGRTNDTDGNLTQVEWLKDGDGNYTNIVSWVPSENLIQVN